MAKAVFYQSIGPELARYDIDIEGTALTRRDAVSTPGANVQYVWPHPSKKVLYVVSSDGGPAPSRAPSTLPPRFASIRPPAR